MSVEAVAPEAQAPIVEQAPAAPVYTVRRDGQPMAEPTPAPVVTPPAEVAPPPVTPAPAPAETPKPAEAAPPVADDVDPVVKTYGEDAKKVLDAWKAGDLQNYLKVAATDYKAMSDEDVFRLDIQQKNPGASDKLINSLLKQQLSKYDSGSFADDDKEAGEELRKLDADKVRDAFEAAKASYQIPTPTAPAPDPEAQKFHEEQQAVMKEVEAVVVNHPVLKAFEMNPVIQLGEGEDALAFSVDPSLNVTSLTNPGKMLEASFFSKNETTGQIEFDMARYIDVRNYALNPKKVQQELINHGKALAAKAEFTARVNPGTEQAAPPAAGAGTKYTVRRG